MKSSETVKTQRRIFRVQHSVPGDFQLDYILLPCGYAYNSDISKAKKGDKIRWLAGEDWTIYCVRKIKLLCPETDILCRMRYGITIQGALMRWHAAAQIAGNGTDAISKDECLWVILTKEDLSE